MNQLQAQQEVRVSREDEARRLKLEEETSADMALLRAILDAEHRAREVEEAAQQRRTGLEERIQGRKDEIAAEQAEAAARREALQKKYQLAREGYVQRVFDIVTGKRDE
jgi:uncharacterized protein YacL (UPF0231 family)